MSPIASSNQVSPDSAGPAQLALLATIDSPYLVSPMPSPDVKSVHERASDQALFYPMALHKLVVMSLCTFRLYELYWFYRNWKLLRNNGKYEVSPFWRAYFFNNVYAYSLFRYVHRQAETAGVRVPWSAGVLATLFVAGWVLPSHLPGPLFLLAWLTFVPLLHVQRTINAMHEARGWRVTLDNSYSMLDIAVIILGGAVFVLTLVGTLLGTSGSAG